MGLQTTAENRQWLCRRDVVWQTVPNSRGGNRGSPYVDRAVYEMRRIWKRRHCSKASTCRLETDVATSNVRLALDKLSVTLRFQVILACDEFPTCPIHSQSYIPCRCQWKSEGSGRILLLSLHVLHIINSLWVRLTASLVSHCVAWQFGVYLVLTKVLTYCLHLFVHFSCIHTYQLREIHHAYLIQATCAIWQDFVMYSKMNCGQVL